MKTLASLASAALLSIMSAGCLAGEGDLPSVYLDWVAVLPTAFGLHQSGNMEIKIRGGFVPPPGVFCDSLYITTLKSRDSDRAMLNTLRDAVLWSRPVGLHITDNPLYQAYPGRCSLMSAAVLRP